MSSSFSKAADLLREAANLLIRNEASHEDAPKTENKSSDGEVQGTEQGGPQAASRVLQNFRTLFQGYNTSTNAAGSSSRSTSSTRSRSNTRTRYYVRETWTHEFCCLSKKGIDRVPSKAEKLALLSANLGRKKIVFGNKDDAVTVKSTLEKSYPKLKEGGGFELLRGGVKPGKLLLIRPSNTGYNVPYLRDMAGLGQAIVYIRPIQKDLDESEAAVSVNGNRNENPVTVVCFGCGQSVQMSLLKAHHEKCVQQSQQTQKSVITIKDDDKDVDGNENCNGRDCLPSKKMKTDDEVETLKELFPTIKKEQVRSILQAAKGDVEKAAAMLVDDSDVSDDEFSHSVFDYTKGKTVIASEKDFMRHYCKMVNTATEFFEFNRMQQSTLRQLMKIYKNPSVDLKKTPDVAFVGECGADVGGPTKEFFHIGIASLSKVDPLYNFQLFTGQEGHLVPQYGADVLSSGSFEMAGKLIAHSVLHGGSGMVGLSPAIISYIVTGCVEEAGKLVTSADLPDIDLRMLLEEKVIGKDSLDEIQSEEKDKLEDLLVRHGLTSYIPLTQFNKDAAVQDLLVAEVILTRTLALNTLFAGLNCLGLGDLLRKCPQFAERVFPSPGNAKIDTEILSNKITLGYGQKFDRKDKEMAWQWLMKTVQESNDITGKHHSQDVLNCCQGYMRYLHLYHLYLKTNYVLRKTLKKKHYRVTVNYNVTVVKCYN